MRKFDNVISLGFFCEVAKELERHGLRSQSSPFDWMISERLEKVLDAMNHDFVDFLNPEYLQQHAHDPEKYFNPKYNIHFFHDFNAYDPLYEQIDTVTEKYNRRIANFYDAIRKPTMFLRYLSSQQDLDYAEENFQQIQDTIKSFNAQNDIMFICNSDLQIGSQKVYEVKKDEKDCVARFPVEQNDELREALVCLLSEEQIARNLEFYNKKELARQEQTRKDMKFFTRVKRKIKRILKKILVKKYRHDKTWEKIAE